MNEIGLILIAIIYFTVYAWSIFYLCKKSNGRTDEENRKLIDVLDDF